MSSAGRFLILALILAGLFTLFVVGCSQGDNGVSATSAAQSASVSPDADIHSEQRVDGLVRIPKKGWIGGVLAGFAYWLEIPLWALRLGVVAIVILSGVTISFRSIYISTSLGSLIIIGYILLWIFMPSIDFVPADFNSVTR